MKVLSVTPFYFPATYWGGPIFSQYFRNNALAGFPQVELTVLTTDAAGPQKWQKLDLTTLSKDLYPNYEVIFTPRLFHKSTSFDLFVYLPKLMAGSDIVHLTSVYTFPTLPTLLWCRILKKPLVWSLQGSLLASSVWAGSPKKKIKWFYEKACDLLICKGHAVLHTTSDLDSKISATRIPSAKAITISHGTVVPESFLHGPYRSSNHLKILFMGRIHKIKGIENLFAAMKLLDQEDISLSIYGTGETDYINSLKEKAKDLSILENKVVFMGHVDGNAKQQAFLNADVCIVPSHTENFCVVIAEALSYGVPVIASTGTPWQEVNEKGCGLWVDNDPQTLANAILAIKNMNLEMMGRRGWEWMKKEFTWKSRAESFLSLYREMINENS